MSEFTATRHQVPMSDKMLIKEYLDKGETDGYWNIKAKVSKKKKKQQEENLQKSAKKT